jgi:hypothetical protein
MSEHPSSNKLNFFEVHLDQLRAALAVVRPRACASF